MYLNNLWSLVFHLSRKCELYTGTVCSKYVQNMSIFIPPLKLQKQNEQKILVVFRVLPTYLSDRCKQYAFQVLCLRAFPPCDQSVNYPKPRQFCQEECKVLEQHVCAHEFSLARSFRKNFVPSCARMPPVGSDEHKKCLRLNVKGKPTYGKHETNKGWMT